MSRRTLTQALYDQLADAFRVEPGDAPYAARVVGCDSRTAQKAWDHGWPHKKFPAPPIKERFVLDQLSIRAARQQATEEGQKLIAVRLAEVEADALRVLGEANARVAAADLRKEEAEAFFAQRMAEAETQARQRYNELLSKAQVDALETQVDEANMTKLGRKAASGALFIAASMFQNAKLISEKFTKAFEKADFTPQQALAAGLMLARLTHEANDAARLALENERRRVGDPTEIIGIVGQHEEVQLAQVEVELRAVQEALAEARAQADAKAAQLGSATGGTHGSTGPVH